MKLKYNILCIVIFIVIFLLPQNCLAYIGPGVGLGVLGTIVALFVAFILVLVGFIWYPMKRLIAKFRKDKKKDS